MSSCLWSIESLKVDTTPHECGCQPFFHFHQLSPLLVQFKVKTPLSLVPRSHHSHYSFGLKLDFFFNGGSWEGITHHVSAPQWHTRWERGNYEIQWCHRLMETLSHFSIISFVWCFWFWNLEFLNQKIWSSFGFVTSATLGKASRRGWR